MTTLSAGYPPASPAIQTGGGFAAKLGLLFLALCAVPTLPGFPGGVSAGQALMILSLPVWFQAAMDRQGPVLDTFGRRAATLIATCVVVMMLLSVFSALHAAQPFRTSRPAVSLLTGPAMLLLVVGTVTQMRLYRYVSVMCLSVAATGLVSILATAEPSLRAIIFGETDRASGFFKNPNQYGIVLSAVLPVTLAMACGAAPRRRWLWAGALMVMLVALMLSGSKANLLLAATTLPGCLVLFVFLRWRGPARILMAGATLLGCAAAGALMLAGLAALNPRALRLLNEVVIGGEATHSIVSRNALWDESIALFIANPLLGIGAGQPVGGLSHSHNLLLDYARTLGVPGLALVSLLVAAVLVTCAALTLRALRGEGHPPGPRYLCIGLAAGTVSYLASNMSSDSLGPTTSPYFYATIALGLAARALIATPQVGTSRHRGYRPYPADMQDG